MKIQVQQGSRLIANVVVNDGGDVRRKFYTKILSISKVSKKDYPFLAAS